MIHIRSLALVVYADRISSLPPTEGGCGAERKFKRHVCTGAWAARGAALLPLGLDTPRRRG
jgi:hypothetical protein